MESRKKLEMCRLCLCENERLFNIFEVNDWQGYIAAEVISDVLQFKVSETDFYPHVVCSTCLTKLTDFKLFKECCQKSKVAYDDMFASSETLEKNHSEEEASLAASGVELCGEDSLIDTSSHAEYVAVKAESMHYSNNEDYVSKENNDPDVTDGDDFKEEPFEDIGDRLSGSELCEEGPLREASAYVQLKAVDTVTHFHHLRCLEHKRPQCTSKGAVDAGACTRNIKMDEESLFEKYKDNALSLEVEASSSGTMERVEVQRISSGERTYNAPLIQEDIGISHEVEKEGEMKEKLMGGEGEVCDVERSALEKGVEGESKGLECYHCGNMLMTKRNLIRHMVLHGFGHTYDCDTCGKVFQSKYSLKRHALIHTAYKQYQCAECSKSFGRKCYLTQHMGSHTMSKPYKCIECNKSFSQKCNLIAHMRLHTGSKPYKCAECSKCFTRNYDLINHLRIHTGSKPYKCAECSKSFSDNSNLKKHMKLHTGSKPYKCAECSKCFSQNCDLKKHMRVHTGYKPHKCAECSKCFSRNGDLKKHMRIHTGSKPYTCTECSKCFNQNSNLKVHMKLHTAPKPYKCAECSKCFSQNIDLKKHERTHSL